MNSVLKSDSFSFIGPLPWLSETAAKVIALEEVLHLII